MALAIGSQKSEETKSIVYRWLGGHFDIIDQLPAVDARKIIEFAIGSDRFIIIADHKNEQGMLFNNYFTNKENVYNCKGGF